MAVSIGRKLGHASVIGHPSMTLELRNLTFNQNCGWPDADSQPARPSNNARCPAYRRWACGVRLHRPLDLATRASLYRPLFCSSPAGFRPARGAAQHAPTRRRVASCPSPHHRGRDLALFEDRQGPDGRPHHRRSRIGDLGCSPSYRRGRRNDPSRRRLRSLGRSQSIGRFRWS